MSANVKLAFTTLGCPDWPLQTIIDNSLQYGFDAIDFRGLTGEMNIYKLPEFSDRVSETKSKISDAGLYVSCFSSSVHLISEEKFAQNLEEVTQYSKLCEAFGTRYIRVFGGKVGDTNRQQAVQTAVKQASILGKIAKEHGAKILLETHDDWMAGADVRAVMEQVDPAAVGVLWDVHHPYRVIGEQPEQTWNALGQWIEYTHVKDSRAGDAPGEFHYCLNGEGDIPLNSIVELLLRKGYQGHFTLEWEKKWHPELDPAEIAFPQYVQYMRTLTEGISL
ncbi:sugar phosphate isomerase/epimerase family protein [Paenibacillus thalictri]|uniref:Sugar phosphate isomerase/epimerase n=1 Tax=Paenibacillus thalictri TaxID=2527873 RepID=A0A4Q9DI20_9BACL|nr:sugar phosphate isomerase/epimerase family protein [Paenibacillus thalictri]TBL72726.1 sugar phosphate isomerase/epimerase [Paenibacillus thalictri]